MEKILLVEDADTLREVLSTVLKTEGYLVDAFSDAESALKEMKNADYALILSDFKLPQKNGLDFLAQVRQLLPHTPFIIMTAYGSIDIAIQAMKLGANDFITKPFEPNFLCSTIADVIKHKRIVDRELGKETRRSRKFISEDPQMLTILEQAKKVARVDSSVLILGESGTGKEVFARYIHENSARSQKPFVAVNCAAFPAELLESEFFGHESGSFTGATQARVGLLEIASEGTIFLDEIGDMPPALQVKLLRALQEKEIKYVGGNKTVKINPRIISATNCNLEDALNSGKLREDFYYRLNVISFELTPLRQRPKDIELLTNYFVEYFCQTNGREAVKIEDSAWRLLKTYAWPGNIRELENVLERAVILCAKSIKAEDLGLSQTFGLDVQSIEESVQTLPQVAQRAVRKAEVDLILKTLKQTSGNKTKAALVLGVSYKTLLNKIKEYELDTSSAVELDLESTSAN